MNLKSQKSVTTKERTTVINLK